METKNCAKCAAFEVLRNSIESMCSSYSAFDSGAPAARGTAKPSPVFIWERKGSPSMNFLMVIMASGIARGRVRTTTKESRKMAAIPQIIEPN